MKNRLLFLLFILIILNNMQTYALGTQEIITTNLTAQKIKDYLRDGNDDEMEGIYIQYDGSNPYLLAIIYDNEDSNYKGIFLSGPGQPEWKEGYIKAVFDPAGNSQEYNMVWFSRAGENYRNIKTAFINNRFSFTVPDFLSSRYTFTKIFPGTAQSFAREKWGTGTGFLLNNEGYVITNYHVIENKNHILVRGINGNFNLAYSYNAVLTDQQNDIAILKPEASYLRFTNPPYGFRNYDLPAGSDVFALGYPMRTNMGDEIKLTNGIISSLSGFRGNQNQYQTTASVTPGNSGGPLFDMNGNVIGINSAYFPYANNAFYAVKIRYVSDLIANFNSGINIPFTNNNQRINKNLAELVSGVKDYVYMIEVY